MTDPTLAELTRVFARIGVLSFGGPAGQIALTVASITRAAGSELRIRVEDGYDQAALPLTGAEYSVTVADNGVALGSNLVGGGGSAGSTNISVVRGVTIDI